MKSANAEANEPTVRSMFATAAEGEANWIWRDEQEGFGGVTASAVCACAEAAKDQEN